MEKRNWSFVAYGTSVDLGHNGYEGSVETGNLTLWSLHGKGKLVPASTDGLAFYYTKLCAEEENFTLTADIEVEQWTFSNGQDGFGLMAADAIGSHGGEAAFWNNSYMTSVTRVEYQYDSAEDGSSDTGGRYSMRLGIGAQEKKGITPQTNEEGTQVQNFHSTMRTLELNAPRQGLKPGVYNIVGAHTNAPERMNDIAQLTQFHLSLRRMNDGYVLGYTNEAGEKAEWKYYHDDTGDALTKLDEHFVYVGFFASRNAKIRVRNVILETRSPEEDEPAAPRPVAMVTPFCEIQSAKAANREDYVLMVYANADGLLQIVRENHENPFERAESADAITAAERNRENPAGRAESADAITAAEGNRENPAGRAESADAITAAERNREAAGRFAAEETMKAGKRIYIPLKLRKGQNSFLVSFTPRPGYCPGPYEQLRSYETITIPFSVSYSVHEAKEIYISPCGKTHAAGTREEPMDLNTALKGAVPGQKLILMGERYFFDDAVIIDRGMNGTAQNPICLTAEEGSRPVLDFCGKGEGLAIAADYWYCRGFDVTNSRASVRGVHLAGSHNRLERIYVYRNGSTGLQIACYQGCDSREEWPCGNQIINCTSYLNADPGYTDADGFAAKITVGEGNVFDGCISAYNADDGFDLFAKVEKGATGSVLIRNCLAFRNGYVLNDEGQEIHVGLGNGFKLGGSSIACGHRLEDSIAFANGEKGVDANSSPDAQVKNVISYNNDSYNIGLYTTDAKETAFYVRNVLSVRTEGNLPDKLEARGNQDMGDIYHDSNYYFDGEKSVNVLGEEADISRFADMDICRAIHGGITRGEDGGICLNGFLE